MRKINWSLTVDILILLVLLLTLYPTKSVQAQLAASSGFSYTNITTATNTQIKPANGTFHTLVINSPGATANAITIFDASTGNCTGGTTIATIPTADLPAAMVPTTVAFDLQFTNGLCVTTAGTTPPNITVTYR